MQNHKRTILSALFVASIVGSTAQASVMHQPLKCYFFREGRCSNYTAFKEFADKGCTVAESKCKRKFCEANCDADTMALGGEWKETCKTHCDTSTQDVTAGAEDGDEAGTDADAEQSDAAASDDDASTEGASAEDNAA